MFEFVFKKVLSDSRVKYTNNIYDVIWYKNNKYHRDNDLPAIINRIGILQWWKSGKRHRDNGLPAYISNDTMDWFIKGKLLKTSRIKERSIL